MEGILSGAHSNLLLVQRPALLLFWFYFPFFGAYKKLFGLKKKNLGVLLGFLVCARTYLNKKKNKGNFFKKTPLNTAQLDQYLAW